MQINFNGFIPFAIIGCVLASLGPSQIMGAGMLASSVGEAVYRTSIIAKEALRNYGKSKIHDRDQYMQKYSLYKKSDFDKSTIPYDKTDIEYFEHEHKKLVELQKLGGIVVNRSLVGALSLIPLIGALFWFQHMSNNAWDYTRDGGKEVNEKVCAVESILHLIKDKI